MWTCFCSAPRRLKFQSFRAPGYERLRDLWPAAKTERNPIQCNQQKSLLRISFKWATNCELKDNTQRPTAPQSGYKLISSGFAETAEMGASWKKKTTKNPLVKGAIIAEIGSTGFCFAASFSGITFALSLFVRHVYQSVSFAPASTPLLTFRPANVHQRYKAKLLFGKQCRLSGVAFKSYQLMCRNPSRINGHVYLHSLNQDGWFAGSCNLARLDYGTCLGHKLLSNLLWLIKKRVWIGELLESGKVSVSFPDDKWRKWLLIPPISCDTFHWLSRHCLFVCIQCYVDL